VVSSGLIAILGVLVAKTLAGTSAKYEIAFIGTPKWIELRTLALATRRRALVEGLELRRSHRRVDHGREFGRRRYRGNAGYVSQA
jgi:hypothetical protein